MLTFNVDVFSFRADIDFVEENLCVRSLGQIRADT